MVGSLLEVLGICQLPVAQIYSVIHALPGPFHLFGSSPGTAVAAP